jgi:alpha-methylacyl-CoA racemase
LRVALTHLDGLRVVTTALNLPGPAACARLRDLGASVVKIEPPAGDPFEAYCAPWYRELHAGMEVRRLDLKLDPARAGFFGLLEDADLLVTAQRASALARLGIEPALLVSRFPRLCHVAITGHAPPEEETPGHDLTYMAAHGLVAPPAMPPTLYADMAGAERVVSTALALVIARDREGRGRCVAAPLADAAAFLAQPREHGLTRPGA